MHSPDLSLEDEATTSSLNEMLSFLETTQREMKDKYDVTDCDNAIADLKKVSLTPAIVLCTVK